MKKFLTMLLALVMALSLVACGQTEQPDADKDAESTSTDPFYIWTWNTDYQKILDEVLPKYLSEEQVSRIQIVNVGDSNIYQDKIDAILADPSNEQYPDIMLLEVGYVQKYVQSGQLMKAADLGITAEDMSNMCDYNLKLGSDANGDAYALFWQATPGCWQIRTDLAEKYMGTTDPAELQEMLSTWDKVIEVSKSVNEQSGGKVKLLSGADDLKYVFCDGAGHRVVGLFLRADGLRYPCLRFQAEKSRLGLYPGGDDGAHAGVRHRLLQVYDTAEADRHLLAADHPGHHHAGGGVRHVFPPFPLHRGGRVAGKRQGMSRTVFPPSKCPNG
jgi:ABC-type glycerol-3-phosphate transport system substrate-binding protein